MGGSGGQERGRRTAPPRRESRSRGAAAGAGAARLFPAPTAFSFLPSFLSCLPPQRFPRPPIRREPPGSELPEAWTAVYLPAAVVRRLLQQAEDDAPRRRGEPGPGGAGVLGGGGGGRR